jgi:hypothetical protein
MYISSHVGLMVMGVFSEEEKVEQEVFDGPQASNCKQLNQRLSKASLGAYSSYRMQMMCLALIIYACDILCTTCRVLG